MPITPLHFGLGAALKASLAGAFSFTVFALVNTLVDVEPVVRVIIAADRLHAHVHTYFGASVIAIPCAIFGRPLCEWLLRAWNRRLEPKLKRPLSIDPVISRGAAWSGALLGAWSHVALDSIMHPDMAPLWPFAAGNALLGLISIEALSWSLVGLGVAGVAVLVVARVIR
jgi:hypothetical protein